MVNLNPKYFDINYMSWFFLLICNPQSCPAFSRPRNICLSFSSLSFSRPLVFFVGHFQVVHFQRPHNYLTSINCFYFFFYFYLCTVIRLYFNFYFLKSFYFYFYLLLKYFYPFLSLWLRLLSLISEVKKQQTVITFSEFCV